MSLVNPQNMHKKILVIRFSSIGDIVLCTPVPRLLKFAFPDAEIHFLTKPGYQDLLQENPYIHQIHLLDKHPILKAFELKQLGFDCLIDLHVNSRTRFFKSILDIPTYDFPKINLEKWIAVHFKLPALPPIHIVDRYLQTLEIFGIKNDGKGLDFYSHQNELNFCKKLLPNSHQMFIAWAIGAQHKTKQFPSNKIISILKQCQLPIVLLGGKEDGEMASKISTLFPEQVIHFCGKLTIKQSAAMLSLSKFVVSNDTGLMHIAAALQKPIISIWGNTIPALGMSAYYGNSTVAHAIIEQSDLTCRPCSKIGHDACPQKHFNCMLSLDEQKILSNMHQFWDA